MGRLEAWLLIGFFIFFEPVLRDHCLIVPWNTLPAYAAIYLSIYFLLIARPSLWQFAMCALAGGIAIFSRPNEIIALAAIYGFALLNVNGKSRLWAFIFFAATLVTVGLVTISLNFYFYGRPTSPYMHGESQKFSISNYGVKLYQLFCDGAFLTGNAGLPRGTRTTQILERFPYFLLLLPGAVYLVRSRGPIIYGVFLAIILSVGFYLTYNMVNSPTYFWSYGSYHYFWWIIPWLGFFSYLTFRQALFKFSRPTFLILLLSPIFLYAIVGFKAIAAAQTDGKDPQLAASTDYKDSTYTVNLTALSEVKNLEDIRLQFTVPPSYWGSTSDIVSKVKIAINDAGQGEDGSDFCTSQQGNSYDFSFLAKGLHLNKGDHIHIEFAKTAPPQLERASLLQVKFAPGAGLARFLTP